MLFTGVWSSEHVSRMKRSRRAIHSYTRAQLEAFIKRTQAYVRECRRCFGARASSRALIECLEAAETVPAGEQLLVRKCFIVDLFSHYEKTFPAFDELPQHALLVLPRRRLSVEVYQVDAVMYETMCTLFNEGRRQLIEFDRGRSPKKILKTCRAHYYAAITFAVSFVESYLNGIATDHFIENREILSDADKELLTESDFSKGGRRYLSIRQKALQYPRIICSEKHPPLQESNCPELEFFLTVAKAARDAFMHPTAWSPTESTGLSKEEQLLHAQDLSTLERIVDNAVGLVRRLESTIHGNDDRLSWLMNRSDDGFFPDEAFR